MKRMTFPDGLEVFHLNRAETVFLYREIFREQEYLRHGIHVQDGDCVFDVGANIGMFGVFLARLHPTVRIFAFEPVPPLCEILQANMTLHQVRAQVFGCALGAALSDTNVIYYVRNSLMSGQHVDPVEDRNTTRQFMAKKEEAASLAAGQEPPRSLPNQELILDALLESQIFRVPVRTVSSVITEHCLERIDLLKIDVEKAEHEVIAGIREEDWPKIKQIVMEVHDKEGRVAELSATLARHGFQLAIEQTLLMQDTEVYLVYGRARDI